MTDSDSSSYAVLHIRFNIAAVGGGSYGKACYVIVFTHAPKGALNGCAVSMGDSYATLAGREDVCIIGLAGPVGQLRSVMKTLSETSAFTSVCASNPLVLNGTKEPLVEDGVYTEDGSKLTMWAKSAFDSIKSAPEPTTSPEETEKATIDDDKHHTQVKNVAEQLKGIAEEELIILVHKVGSKYHRIDEEQKITGNYAEIGRDPKCQVRYDEHYETVSSRHAAIMKDDNHWKLFPLSRTNPIFVNGTMVQKEWYLQHGDEIQCAVNGPKLGFVISSVEKNTAESIRSSRSGEQALWSYKRVITVSMCIIILLAIVVGGYFFHKKGKNMIVPSATMSEFVDKNDDKRYEEDAKEKQVDLSESKAPQSVPPAIAKPQPPVQSNGTTYTGYANIPDIESFKMTFILSADKKEISDITIAIKGFKYSIQRDNALYTGSVGQYTSTFYGTHSVQSPSTDITFGNSTLKGLTFNTDGAYAEVKFVYEATVSNKTSSFGDKALIPFPSTRINFKVSK